MKWQVWAVKNLAAQVLLTVSRMQALVYCEWRISGLQSGSCYFSDKLCSFSKMSVLSPYLYANFWRILNSSIGFCIISLLILITNTIGNISEDVKGWLGINADQLSHLFLFCFVVVWSVKIMGVEWQAHAKFWIRFPCALQWLQEN